MESGTALVLLEPELELIHTHMAQKPVLRVEVGARALRVRTYFILKIFSVFLFSPLIN